MTRVDRLHSGSPQRSRDAAWRAAERTNAALRALDAYRERMGGER
jgi:hypothetical protein